MTVNKGAAETRHAILREMQALSVTLLSGLNGGEIGNLHSSHGASGVQKEGGLGRK